MTDSSDDSAARGAVATDDAPDTPSPPRLERLTGAYAAIERRLREPRIRRTLEIALPVAIVGVAALARLTNLGHPHLLVFDETYYVKEGYSMWQLGYEGEWAEDGSERFEQGDASGLTSEADYVVHPPLGKWIIGMAMAVFGISDPFWWRLPSAIAGVVLVALTYAVARGMLRSIAFASLAGFWMAIDGFAIVMSRTALLDGVLAMFVLAGAGALLLDRRGSPARTVRALLERPRRFGVAMLARPWLVIAGALLGAGCATKWSGAAFLAVFGIWTVLMDALDRRRVGFRHPWLGTLLLQAPASFVLLVGPALVIYVASYAGWFDGGWGSQLALERVDLRWGGLLAWVPLGLQSLWMYHAQQLGFHVGLDKDHVYQSPAVEWLWLGRPTAFEMERTDTATWWITAVPNLVVWYAGVVAIGFLLFQVGRRFDRTAGFLLLAIAAGYAPWLAFPERTIFFFYAIVFLPFMVIGLAYALQLLVGRFGPPAVRSAPGLPPTELAVAPARLDTDIESVVPAPTPPARSFGRAATAASDVERRAAGWAAIVLLLVASVAVAIWFMPVAYGMTLSDAAMHLRFWPPRAPG